MAIKPWHTTRWSSNKQHEDELNTDGDMAFSSKHETTVFEIQARDICNPLKEASSKSNKSQFFVSVLLKVKSNPANTDTEVSILAGCPY